MRFATDRQATREGGGGLGAVGGANSSLEAAEFNIKRDFGRGKGAAFGIRKVWQGQGG